MPEHVHLLADGSNAARSLSAFVKHAKQLSGYHGRKVCDRRIWQSGYFERVLREDEDTSGVVDYILMNPVRRGLVATPAEYPFSDSCRPDLQVGRVGHYQVADSGTPDLKVGSATS